MDHVKDETALAEAIKSAGGPVVVRGGGTRGMVAQGEVLSTTGLSGITLYEPGALTIVAQAGTPVAEIDATLAQENQRLAFEPMDHRALLGTDGEPTIGGVIAGNVSGPRRIQGGAARDYALGVRFVDGMGNIVKNGGRVMKNVTGYDLVKLMCGSWGTLGVLTEVSLKVLPVPEVETSVMLEGLAPDAAVRAMSAALGSPFDVTGAAHDPATARTWVRLEGFADSVAYRAAELAGILTEYAAPQVVTGEDSKAAWMDIRDVTGFTDQPGDVWRISVAPTDGSRVLEAAGADAALMDWGGGLIWLRTTPGSDLRARLTGIGGHATLMRAEADTYSQLARFHPEPVAVEAIATGLRTKFDPRGILNPGLMTSAQAA